MAGYVCADCGDNVKESDLRKLFRDGGKQKWVCKECYATYPDDDDEEEDAINTLKPKGEKVELLRGKEVDIKYPKVIIGDKVIENLQQQLKEAEEVRDSNYDLYTKAETELKMMKGIYREDVVAVEMKNMALNEKYKKLNWLVKNKVILKFRWISIGYVFGVGFMLSVYFIRNLMGW